MLSTIVLALTATLAGPQQDVPSPDMLRRICSVEGAYGERFGTTKLAGKVSIETSFSVYFDPVAPVPSLQRYDAGVTKHGRVFFRFSAWQPFKSLTAAQQAVEIAATRIEGLGGWWRAPDEREEPSPDDPQAKFHSDPQHREDVGVSFELYTLGRMLVFECYDRAGRTAAWDEAYGSPPHTATVPEQPVIPKLPPIPALADCMVPTKRDAILADRDAMLAAYRRFGRSGPDYANRLAEWRSEELVQRGLWTEDRRKAFGYDLLGDPAFRAALDRGMALIGVMTDHGVALEDAQRRGDRGGQCRATIRLMTTFRDIIASAQTQWDVVIARFDAEAKRLGVTF